MGVDCCRKSHSSVALNTLGGRVRAVYESDGSLVQFLPGSYILILLSSYPGMLMCTGGFVWKALWSLRLSCQGLQRLKMLIVKYCFQECLIQLVPTELANLKPREVTWLV